MVRRIEAGARSQPEGDADPIAARTFTPIGGEALAGAAQDAEQEAQQQADQADQAEQLDAMAATVGRVLIGVMRAARSWVARSLPEIRAEWTDEALRAPAEAAVPLLRKHLATAMQYIGEHAELAAFVVACVPLGVGYMAAVERHQATVDMAPSTTAENPPDAPA